MEVTYLWPLAERKLHPRSVGGGGFQAALGGPVFAALAAEFGAEMEGFASPLNCRYPTVRAALGRLSALSVLL